MAELFSILATVSRPVAMGDTLTLTGGSRNNPGSEVVAFGPGDLSWRLNEQKSPFISGSMLVSAVKDTRTVLMSVRTWGSSIPDLFNRIAVMCRAFEQFSYVVGLNIDGSELAYLCQPANYSTGNNGELDKLELGQNTQVTTFSIPTNPIPILGGI